MASYPLAAEVAEIPKRSRGLDFESQHLTLRSTWWSWPLPSPVEHLEMHRHWTTIDVRPDSNVEWLNTISLKAT
jgi:hypothetical protein